MNHFFLFLFLFFFISISIFIFIFKDAVDIHIDCKSKHSIAMHWGTVADLGVEDIEYGPAELREALDKRNISHEEFHDVYIGQMITLEKKN